MDYYRSICKCMCIVALPLHDSKVMESALVNGNVVFVHNVILFTQRE